MRGKLAVVDPARCQGHGECIPACPLGAIFVARGHASNRVTVPDLDANFETSVPGLYIVGELGGRALIKNAVNEGRVAAEHVAQVAAHRRSESGLAAQGVADVAIVGSGPSGLSAGLVAHRAKLDYFLLEQGTLAETVRKYPRHKVLFAEPLTMPLYGDLWVSDASKESLLAVWESVIERTGLRVRTGQQVRQIARERDCFVIATADAAVCARAVVLALGRRGTPRRLGIPGEDLPTVFYDVAEMADFAGRRVLVVGGGDSAIESALGLASQTGTTVTLSYRGDSFTRLKDRNRARVDAAITSGRVTTLMCSKVREIRSDVAVLDIRGTTKIVPCDDVVIRIGGEPPTALLQQLGVRMVTKELATPAAGGRFGSDDAA
jgi:thioredoxin reductase